MFKGRSVIELMVLWLMVIAGVMILLMGIVIAIVKIKDPDVDVDRATDALFSAITLILGALLGMLTVKAPNLDDKDLDKPFIEEKEVDTERTD